MKRMENRVLRSIHYYPYSQHVYHHIHQQQREYFANFLSWFLDERNWSLGPKLSKFRHIYNYVIVEGKASRLLCPLPITLRNASSIKYEASFVGHLE